MFVGADVIAAEEITGEVRVPLDSGRFFPLYPLPLLVVSLLLVQRLRLFDLLLMS